MKSDAQFAVCISNKGYAASLEVRKIYRLIPDKAGSKHGLVRVVDEMGEDYLFPEEYFVSLRLPQAAERAEGNTLGRSQLQLLRQRHDAERFVLSVRELRERERVQLGN